MIRATVSIIVLLGMTGFAGAADAPSPSVAKPNILFIFSDDHALQSISAYQGRFKDVAPTPNLDRLANEGALFENSFCANSICGPSRACILTGKWHLHGQPQGFDHWEILEGQGNYYNPVFIRMDGTTHRETGYATDIVTEKAMDWLDKRWMFEESLKMPFLIR